MDFLVALKNFLSDRPETAFLALCILAIVVLWRNLVRSEAEKLELALQAIPVIDKIRLILQLLLHEKHFSRKGVKNGESGKRTSQALPPVRKEGEGST
jgi:hypothetical protein